MFPIELFIYNLLDLNKIENIHEICVFKKITYIVSKEVFPLRSFLSLILLFQFYLLILVPVMIHNAMFRKYKKKKSPSRPDVAYQSNHENAEWLNKIFNDLYRQNLFAITVFLEKKLRNMLPANVQLTEFKLSKEISGNTRAGITTILYVRVENSQSSVKSKRLQNTFNDPAKRNTLYINTDFKTFNNDCYLFLQASFFTPKIKLTKISGILIILFDPSFEQKKIKVRFLQKPVIEFEVTRVCGFVKNRVKSKILKLISSYNFMDEYEIDLN